MKISSIVRWLGSRKIVLGIAAPVVVLVIAGVAFYRAAPPPLPTAEVRRGEFVDTLEVRGEIKTKSSIQLVAPSFAGDLQIVKLARTGTMVKKNDVVVRFDASNLASTFKKQQSQFKAAEADIEQSRAQAHLTEEQQATDLLQANYDVERARLDTSKQEIVSEIEGKETRLKLEDAEQKLKELQQKNTSSRTSADADVEGKKHKEKKAHSDVQRTEHQISSLTLLAPADGMVTVLPNFGARNWYSGGNTPDFKEGDRAWPGAAIAALPDMSSFRVDIRVDETDRGRLKLNQAATVRIDAIPDKEFKSTVLEISPLAKVDYSSWPFPKNFDIVVEILESDPRIRPGMSATARIAVEKYSGSLLVPPQAVFEKNGGAIVYVLRRSKFEERPVQVGRRSKTMLQILNGLEPGEKVALKNPAMEQTP